MCLRVATGLHKIVTGLSLQLKCSSIPASEDIVTKLEAAKNLTGNLRFQNICKSKTNKHKDEYQYHEKAIKSANVKYIHTQ